MRRTSLVTLSALVFFLGGTLPVVAAEKPICSALLYDDAELMSALPARLKPLVESAHYRALITDRETAWKGFHTAMDSALNHPDQSFFGSIGTTQVFFKFHRRKKGDLELWIDFLKRKDHPIGEGLESGQQFADYVMAQLGWIAKARATGKITDLKIIGKEPRNKRIITLLESLGFKSVFPKTRCMVWGLIGAGAGGFAGWKAGGLYFAKNDADVEGGTIDEEGRKYYRDHVYGASGGLILGGAPAIALACFRKTGRNFSIEFRPGELAPNPDTLPPGGKVPPIDLDPPGGEPIWPPKPMPPALPAPKTN